MRKLGIILPGVTALLGVATAIAPYTFAEVCKMQSMHCRSVTAPTVLVLGTLIFVISVVQLILAWKKR